jgi:hypothetical protein
MFIGSLCLEIYANSAIIYHTFRSIPSILILTMLSSECTTTPECTFAPADGALEGGHHADADVLCSRQPVQQVHRAHQMHRGDSLLILEDFGKMSDGTAQRPVAKYVAFLEASFRIEEVLILPPWLAAREWNPGPVFRTENGK